ncbi:MAG: TIGR03621 family F420-dependent LLM class oxidoreductase, partial [Chloroflexi bacterium]|nr:TIGR03621 family F420-dependent LLM class oxidoreductase [Chloroflexota bacterium]
MRPFRFGVNSVTTSRAEWEDTARKAEALGYDTLIAQDHFANQLAPVPSLATAAAVTTRLRLATLVLDNDFRHPAVVAKEAATLDVLSEGRFELGLGAGWLQADYTKTGLRLDPPAVRLARLIESAQIIKALLSSTEPVTFTGEHYQIENLEPLPRPVQRPHPPLMLGGRQRRMLSRAAREADILGLSLLDPRAPGLPPPPSFAQKVAWVREAAAERFDNLELHVNASLVQVTDQPSETEIQRVMDRTGQTRAQVLASPGTLVGSVDA